MIEARPDTSSVELGYVLSKRLWGQRLMLEAVEAVVDCCWEDPDVWRVWAVADMENVGSRRLLEKAGMTLEGVLHRWALHPNIGETPRDVACYATWRTKR